MEDGALRGKAEKGEDSGEMAQKKRSIGVYILLGLLLVGLAGFGGTTLTGTTNRIGTVGSRDITAQEFYNRLRSQIDGFSRQIGVPISFAQAQAMGLDQMVLASLVQERALDTEMDRLGLSAGDARVRDTILSFPEFQSLTGEFDRERYRQALQAQGLNEGQFEDGIRVTIARQLLEAAVRSAASEPAAYGEVIAAWRGETRDITWAALGPEALATPVPEPTDEELRAHYDANPAAYTLPERREITYAWLTPAMIMDQVVIDDADVQALYDSRIDEFVSDERRLVERLVYPDTAAAEAAKVRIDAGAADFETLVAERGLDLADTDMGDVARGQLGAAADAVFAAEVGDVVGPVQTTLGPALFRVNAVLAAQETTLDEVAEDLRGELALQRAQRLIQEQSEDFVDLLAGGATVAELAETTDMELGEITWSDGMTEGIAAYDAFRSAAAAAREGDFPELREFDDGGVFVLELDGIVPPELQPFDEVRDRVAADRAAAATAEALRAEAERIAALVREGGFAQEGLALAPTAAPALRRSDFLEGTPPGFVERVFAMEPGDVAVVPSEAGAIIVALDAVHAADPADPAVAAEMEQIGREAAQGIDADLFAAFATAIQLGTPVTLDQAAITALYSQIQ